MLDTKFQFPSVIFVLAFQFTLATSDFYAPFTLNAVAENVNSTSAKICWDQLLFVSANNYELLLVSEDSRVRSLTVRTSKTSKHHCHVLKELKPSSHYTMAVRLLSSSRSHHPIAESELSFRTTEDEACVTNPCRKCVPLPGSNGQSACQCQSGTECRSDVISDESEDCQEECNVLSDGPEMTSSAWCQNGGTPTMETGRTRCACPKQFSGDNCELSVQCTGALRCQNGGLCTVNDRGAERCDCADGFFGERCENADNCADSPCQNGGYCRNVVAEDDYHCFCYDGFYGRNCTRHDPCSSSPCQNNGLCRNLSDAEYACRCRPGFHGDNCELYSPCADSPCLHHGMCNSIDGRYFCDCEAGRFGRRCEHVNLCRLLRPCGPHSVACHNTSDSGYKCSCELGWSGENCTFHNPCYNRPCLNDGVCVPLTSSNDFRCDCADGFWGDLCEMVNPCFGSPCSNAGTCINTSASTYVCRCPTWFYGDHCEFANSCARSNRCVNGAECLNTSKTDYTCRCPGEYYGEFCQHYNSCAANPCRPGRCQLDGDVGKYACVCPPGYSGFNCQHYSPCSSGPCRNDARCLTRQDGGFTCRCVPGGGHYGPLCDFVDACASAPCHRGATCVNVPPTGFRCLCPGSAFGRLCEGRDVCAARTATCKNGGTCVPRRRTDSSSSSEYACQCPVGYFGAGCEYWNPCSLAPCLHGGSCVYDGSTEDRYACRCDIEFQGRNCAEEIPCNAHGKKCYNDGVCRTEANGTVSCQCPDGYFGFRCQNYDPCAGKRICSNGGTCQVTDSGLRHQCLCQVGFFGDHCEFHRTCINYVCRNNGTCVKTATSDICYCKSGFTGRFCEMDLNECESRPCHNGGKCVDLPGRYECRCTEGYAGDSCQNQDVCSRDEMLTPKGIFVWPATVIDTEARVECPRNPDSYAIRRCRHRKPDGRARWDPADLSKCAMGVSSASAAREALSPYRSENLTDQLVLSDVLTLLRAVLQFAVDDSQVAIYALEIVDRILSLPDESLHATNYTDRILQMLEKFSENAKLTKGNMSFVGENLEVVVRYTSWIDHEAGTSFRPQVNVQGSSEVYLSLPAEAFQKDISKDRVKFLYLRNSKLFRGTFTQPTYDVVFASVGSEKIQDLKSCVKYVIPNRQISKYNRCVYWNSDEHMWTSDGIETLSYRGRRTVCCSNRLAYFGVTNDTGLAAMTFVREDFEMTVATHSGLGLAVACLAIVLLTHVACRSFNEHEYGQMVIHLTSSMLASNVCLMLGYNRFQVESETTCAVIAVLGHFFALSTQFWFVVIVAHILRDAPTGHSHRQSVFLCKRIAFAWGLPLFPVTITVAVDLDEYRTNPESCLMTGGNRYVYCSSYLLPICAVLLVSLVLWAIVFRSFYSPVERRSLKSTVSANQVFGVFMVNFLADLSWFVFFASTLPYASHQATYLQYSHFIMQGTTGLAALLAFVIMRNDVTINCRRHDKRRSCGLLSKSLSYEKDGGNTVPSSTGPAAAAAAEAVKQTKRSGDHLFALRQKHFTSGIQDSSSDDKGKPAPTKKESGSKEGRNDSGSKTHRSRSGQSRKGTSAQALEDAASGNHQSYASYLLAGPVDGHRTDTRGASNREVASDDMLVHTSV